MTQVRRICGMPPIEPALIGGSAVSVDGRAALITGSSGSGKSSLALELISRGAELVADDKIQAQRIGGAIDLSAPPQIAGLIEARGIGILRLKSRKRARLAVVVDLDEEETERLPQRITEIQGLKFPLIRGRGREGLAAALTAMLRMEPLP